MSAVKAVRAVLTAASAVTAIVSTRIVAGVIPQNTSLPAISLKQISGLTLHRNVALTATVQPGRHRVQVSLVAATYADKEALKTVVKAALHNRRGTFNSVEVSALWVEAEGPDFEDPDAGTIEQSIDVMVTLA